MSKLRSDYYFNLNTQDVFLMVKYFDKEGKYITKTTNIKQISLVFLHLFWTPADPPGYLIIFRAGWKSSMSINDRSSSWVDK